MNSARAYWSVLKQPGYKHRRPQPQGMRLTLSFQPVLEPRRHGAVGTPRQRRQAPEELLIKLACLTPGGQNLDGRRPLPGLGLRHNRPVEAEAVVARAS